VRFPSSEAAHAALADRLDARAPSAREDLADGVALTREVMELGGGAFSNVYTLEWDVAKARAEHVAPDPPRSALEVARACPDALAVATGSFFFLADRAGARPRRLNLNLRVEGGVLWGAPMRDQEVLLRSRGGALRVETLRARGVLELGGEVLEWEGSRTGREAECTLFGSGHCVIRHEHVEGLGRARVLDAASTRTPPMESGARADVGLERDGEGGFVVAAVSREGGLDHFAHELAARVPSALARVGVRLRVRSVDGLEVGEGLWDGVSAGPSVWHEDLESHPTDRDRSLGSTPLLTGRRASRMVFSRHGDRARFTLFDARPGSLVFVGATLGEAAAWVRARGAGSGCLLDSGNTPKLALARGGEVESLGNRHYLRWPTEEDPTYLWTPDRGRPTASLWALCGR
jgi:hypothetical protein